MILLLYHLNIKPPQWLRQGRSRVEELLYQGFIVWGLWNRELSKEWVLTYLWKDMEGAGEVSVWKIDLENQREKKPQIVHVMHWHVWTSWSFQLNVASQGYLVSRVWLQRVAGGEACRILLPLYLVVDLGFPSLLAVRKKRWTWWVKSKGKLEATGPSSLPLNHKDP